LHSDNGYEFVNALLHRYARDNHLAFTRSRPYRKNDNAHVEQRNGSLRKLIGYDRFDTQSQIDWLNSAYDLLDPYSNLLLPSMKLLSKQRRGATVHHEYDAARTPLERLIQHSVLTPQSAARLQSQALAINLLARCRKIHQTLLKPPKAQIQSKTADNDS
jgi:transposase InsO family protein